MPQYLENLWYVLRRVLAVPVNPDYIVESQFKGELVSSLHRSAEPQMMRQLEHLGAGLARHTHRCVR
jgi:hypothetical protein